MDSLPRKADARQMTYRTLNDLLPLAHQYGVRVHVSHLDNGVGAYDHYRREIHLAFGLSPVEQRCILAHELGHAYYGHESTSPRYERQADIFAAQLLIDATEYAAAEQQSPHVHDLADTLEVTPDVVTAYQDLCLHRLGQITYGRQHRGNFTNPLARALFARQEQHA